MTKDTDLKRRRVARACQSCRALKSRCDGRQPVCSRCAGYGHQCQWAGRTPTSRDPTNQRFQLNQLLRNSETRTLRDTLRTYLQLLQDIRPRLNEADRRVVDVGVLTSHKTISDFNVEARRTTDATSSNEPTSPQRYLGEASDIGFYNSMRKAMCSDSIKSTSSSPYMASYDHDEDPEIGPQEHLTNILPGRDTADKYCDIYFSTIHIAYPFVSRKTFQQNCDTFWQPEPLDDLSSSWLSLLLTIFAVGACYETLSDAEGIRITTPTHQMCFEHALALSSQNQSERSSERVTCLLAQCFYLLATSQTDRCWITLGTAIRLAQAIGLHADYSPHTPDDDVEKQETRRRLWYSLYVLDRLLSLQLGRPPAIYDGHYKTTLPESSAEDGSNEYFLVMIQFSAIIGRVLDHLYNPGNVQSPEDALSAMTLLNQELLQWKSDLPRKLRFDLSHTLENSVTFRRQRNMLAIKFYHLRSLIHRPCLSPAKLFRSPGLEWTSLPPSLTKQLRQSAQTCVSAAQNTARLLYHLDDKKSLVYGFPWWQMISCLICASSILLVASISSGDDQLADKSDLVSIDEDVDVCLRVVEALSTNSHAAMLARDMMKALKETRVHAERPRRTSQQALLVAEADAMGDPASPQQSAQVISSSTLVSPEMLHDSFLVPYNQQDVDFGFAQEVSEPIMWSAQFVKEAYNPFRTRYNEYVEL